MAGFSAHGHGKWVPRALTLSSRWQGSLSVSCPLVRRRVLSFSFFVFLLFYVCSNFGYVVFVVILISLLADLGQLA